MTIEQFPPIDSADEYGLLAVGGDLEVESLVLAYRNGIFPWPIFDEPLMAWFAPPERALLFLDEFRVSKSLEKTRAKNQYTFAVDRNFEAVIAACAELTNRKVSLGTWITDEVIAGYTALHHAGFCHSIECYRGETLVGGLYGVSIAGMFAGESMFYREPNASKLALWYLVELLKKQGVKWIDCQQLTPLFQQFGAREVQRAEFMDLLNTSLTSEVVLLNEKTRLDVAGFVSHCE